MNKSITIFFTMIVLIISSFTTVAFYQSEDVSFSTQTVRKSGYSNSAQSEIIIGNISSTLGRIQVEVKNIGDDAATDIEWNIEVSGGIVNQNNKETQGTIDTIDPGESVTVETGFLIGVGEISIDITIDSIGKSVDGTIFLFFITINPDFVVTFDIIADGFNSPIYATTPNDGTDRLFVVDQIGIIYIIEDGILLSDPFLDISDKIVDLDPTYDERGLLGFAFHPDYGENGRFFVYYSHPKSGPDINHETILAEYTITSDRNSADENSEKIIFQIDQPEANHNGGQLVFGPDGYLYLGLGDGGGAGDQHGDIGNGQNVNTALGSIIRIDVDEGDPYAIPDDNPFVGSGGLDEIYAFGLRNPWRFSFDRDTDELFVADVGQDEWEEVNIVVKGGNYGWRILEGTHPYDPDLADELGIDIEDLEEPIHEYSHSLGKSITGGYVYRGSDIPELQGKYVFGDWSSSFVRPRGSLFYLEEIEPGTWQRFNLITSEPFNRFLLSFGEDEEGELYVLSKTILGPTGSSGDIRKIIIE